MTVLFVLRNTVKWLGIVRDDGHGRCRDDGAFLEVLEAECCGKGDARDVVSALRRSGLLFRGRSRCS